MAARPEGSGAASLPPATFPSVDWFQHLADLMNANRARQEQLGYVDCVAGFRVDDADFQVLITFEEFEVVEVRAPGAGDEDLADFVLTGDLATWREMIESIVAGNGKPDLEHTLNRLSHMGEPFHVDQDDPLRKDMYFRYNQSFQEFFNACSQFDTVFAG
ncbi:MAG: hypothetical protein PVH91_11125 [Pseudomonadales bacterium]|jgi:hypothetical protein